VTIFASEAKHQQADPINKETRRVMMSTTDNMTISRFEKPVFKTNLNEIRNQVRDLIIESGDCIILLSSVSETAYVYHQNCKNEANTGKDLRVICIDLTENPDLLTNVDGWPCSLEIEKCQRCMCSLKKNLGNASFYTTLPYLYSYIVPKPQES
jgi:hypothetical protein